MIPPNADHGASQPTQSSNSIPKDLRPNSQTVQTFRDGDIITIARVEVVDSTRTSTLPVRPFFDVPGDGRKTSRVPVYPNGFAHVKWLVMGFIDEMQSGLNTTEQLLAGVRNAPIDEQLAMYFEKTDRQINIDLLQDSAGGQILSLKERLLRFVPPQLYVKLDNEYGLKQLLSELYERELQVYRHAKWLGARLRRHAEAIRKTRSTDRKALRRRISNTLKRALVKVEQHQNEVGDIRRRVVLSAI